MRRKHARYARAAVVFRGPSASKDARHAVGREVCWSCNRVVNVPPVKAQARLLRIQLAELAAGAAGLTPGKFKGGLERK